MHANQDLYEVLGLQRGASRDDVRRAHRRLVREYHPDANPQDPRRAEERFKEVQRAYEVLSDEEKRREYDRRLRTTSLGGSPDRPRARGAGEGTGGRTTSRVNLSDVLRKLGSLSSDPPGDGRREGSFQLRGEDIARIARHLGVDVSRLSRLLGENIRVNARVSFGDARSDRSSATGEDTSDRRPSGASNEPREKRPKSPGEQGREKRVKGPKAQRRDESD